MIPRSMKKATRTDKESVSIRKITGHSSIRTHCTRFFVLATEQIILNVSDRALLRVVASIHLPFVECISVSCTHLELQLSSIVLLWFEQFDVISLLGLQSLYVFPKLAHIEGIPNPASYLVIDLK